MFYVLGLHFLLFFFRFDDQHQNIIVANNTILNIQGVCRKDFFLYRVPLSDVSYLVDLRPNIRPHAAG